MTKPLKMIFAFLSDLCLLFLAGAEFACLSFWFLGWSVRRLLDSGRKELWGHQTWVQILLCPLQV